MAQQKRKDPNPTKRGQLSNEGAKFPGYKYDPLQGPDIRSILPVPGTERRGVDSVPGSFEPGEKGTSRTGSGN